MAAAVAHGFAASLTAKMSEDEVRKRGPVQPWDICPSIDTPAWSAAREKLENLRAAGKISGKKIRIKF